MLIFAFYVVFKRCNFLIAVIIDVQSAGLKTRFLGQEYFVPDITC